MRRAIIIIPIFCLAVVGVSSTHFAQDSIIPPGWRTCPRCQTPAERKANDKFKPEGMPYNNHDLSGVWGYAQNPLGPLQTFTKKVPPMTEWAKERFNATLTEYTADGTKISNIKAPLLICDPLGWPRLFTYNYGFEFIVLPDRVLQFIEWGHSWRPIWTDGRKLPDTPPDLRFMGWNVGHWDGDTLIVESNGYDDRSWVNENYPEVTGGLVHSDEMRLVERWRRTSYSSLEGQITIYDPKAYTEPWVGETVTWSLQPNTEIWEKFCVTSDSLTHVERVLKPAAGAK